MRDFMGRDFLLHSNTAKTLYFDCAETMPIVDYHCHISPREIYENKRFSDLAEAWLGADHYKWRLMRSCGVEEKYITGDASPWEKFAAFAEILPRAAGNPVHHWAHLELQRYFGCHTPLTKATAPEIWEHCNAQLATDPSLRVRGIIERSKVTTIVTTDDPVESLEWHAKLAKEDSFATAVLPAWRPDRVIAADSEGFSAYIHALSTAAGVDITGFDGLKRALAVRMDHFAAHGCRASDHGISRAVYAPAPEEEVDGILRRRLSGEPLTAGELRRYQYALLLFLGREYARREWVMEIHFSAQRNVNARQFQAIGPDAGYDVICPQPGMNDLAAFLDALEGEGMLPRTLLFSLNANDNDALNALAGSFQQPGTMGKVQQGSAWWFNDHIGGMTAQMRSFASMGALANFIGMLTDSRSFLSYTRHEYFRRILCNLLGDWVERGEYPADMAFLGEMVNDISYRNAMAFFGY